MKTRFKHCLAACALGAVSLSAQAQVSDDVVKIGVLGDQSGMMADLSGKFGVEAVKMAVEDFGGTVLGKPIEVVSADHQNKVDIGVSIARRWYENEKVDLILDVPNSAIALAVQDLTRQMKRVVIFTSAGSADLTGKACSPNGMHWTYDTYAYATGVASGVMEDGGKSWYFITSDYAFGHSLERDAMAVVKAKGGQVVGSVRHPIASADFSSFLLQAQSSKAQILGMANAGGDTINTIKAANEFGVTKTMKMAGLLVFINDVHSLGLEATKGMYLTDGWYWDQSDASRAWSKKFEAKVGRKPSMLQAGDYSSVTFYLNGVKATGTDDADTLMKWMKSNKINDFFTQGGYVREDGRMIHDMYLMQVKTPAESKGPWDYYKVVATLPGDEVYTKLSESTCKLVKK